jgi:orotate phosphoribosyltransferase
MSSDAARAAGSAGDRWVEDLLDRSGALRRGHFRLSSGLHSSAYVQCALVLQEPIWARRLGTALAAALRGFGIDSVVAPALGGLIIGHEVAAAANVPFRFVERQGDGFALRRGFGLRAGERVALIEDVVTTAKSTLEAAKVVGDYGGTVVCYGAILDRGGGGNLGSTFRALLALSLPSYPEAECPSCAAGEPVEKPGSRPG